jgi:hypothetical protein
VLFQATFVAALVGVLVASGPPLAHGEDLLINGDFEDGATGWQSQSSPASCTPNDGDNALEIASPNTLQQTVEGPLASGEYTFSGYAQRTSGGGSLTVMFVWLDSGGAPVQPSQQTFTLPPGAFVPIQFGPKPKPANAVSLRIVLQASPVQSTSALTVCFDDMALDGPGLATATPLPTDTPSPAPTETSTPDPTETTAPNPSPGATSTTAPSATSTSVPSTNTPSSKTATPVTAKANEPSYVFTNGSFEEGTDGWQKFGGELGVATEPRVSGNASGMLTSSTTSTKWAYQTVAVDQGQTYEFSGYVQASSGVSRALLRISWYKAADGSGEAISSSDSTADVSGASGGFVFLSTGAVQPPAGALTAKTRVLLTPSGAGTTSLYMDDLSFGVASTTAAMSTPAAPAQTSTPAASATTKPETTSTTGSRRSSTAAIEEAEAPAGTATPGGLVSEVSAVRAPKPTAAPLTAPIAQPADDEDHGVPLLWLAAGTAFVVGLMGTYWQSKHRRP